MRRCRRVLDLLGDYLSSDLDPRARQFVQSHLSKCPRCAAEFEASAALLRRLPSERGRTAPAEIRERLLASLPSPRRAPAPSFRPYRLVWGMASAAASVVTALVLVYVMQSRPGASEIGTPAGVGILPVPGRVSPFAAEPESAPPAIASAEDPFRWTRTLPLVPVVPNRGIMESRGRAGAPSPLGPLVSLDPRESLMAPLPSGLSDATVIPLPTGPAARELATEDHPHPRATGAVVGEVYHHGQPQADIVVRLVCFTNSTFVRERRAMTDGEGHYRFIGVPPGLYRVYAYAGDNRDWFNRETPPVEVRVSLVKAPPISLGRLLTPDAPPPQTKVLAAAPIVVRWSECPGSSEYEVTVLDPDTRFPVFHARVSAAEIALPAASLLAGHTYQLDILALAPDGSFLGGTAGAGAAPWVVMAL